MMGPTHALTGVAAGLAVAALTGQTEHTPIIAYGLAGATALLPDLDQHRSLASRRWVNKPAHLILKHFRHRRFTHSLLGTALFGTISLMLWALVDSFVSLSLNVFWVALAGWVSHLVADAFNKQGIQLFYPYANKRLEWISIPLPKALRISTIHDPKGVPFTLGRLQARIHTEKWFFKVPVMVLIGFVLWHNIDGLVLATRNDVWVTVNFLPDPLREVLTALLARPELVSATQ